jgi:S-disulfanyl-L-cysteine oxidoreductase SoxD
MKPGTLSTMLYSPCTTLGLAVGFAIALAGLSVPAVRAEQAKTVNEGVYTEAQATRGQGMYGQQCASCHATDLTGSGAPALVGKDFLSVWGGMSVDDLVEKIATSMPSGAPGSLSRVQSADLVAFILKSNGFPAGFAELDSDAATLKAISIIK